MRNLITASGALLALTLALIPAKAENVVTEREKKYCQADYHKYCSEYGLGSEALRACMSRNIKKISRGCVSAFVAAGEMTQAQADKLRGKGKTVKKKTAHKKTTHKTTKTKR